MGQVSNLAETYLLNGSRCGLDQGMASAHRKAFSIRVG